MENQSSSATCSQDGLAHATVLAQHANSIRQLHKHTKSNIIEIGRLLCECKQLLEHGHWLSWLQREFAWSERTARNYISVYRFAESKSVNVADLSIDLASLYLITAPSTAAEARTEVIERIGAGEELNRAEIQRVVQQAKHNGPAPHRRSSSISVEEMMERTGRKVLRRLSPIERQLWFERALYEGEAIANEWAEEITRLGKKHRQLLIALDFVETVANQPIRKIVKEIKGEQYLATVRRVKEASEFFEKLCSELTRNGVLKNVPQAHDKRLPY
jgi:hypothetical protein